MATSSPPQIVRGAPTRWRKGPGTWMPWVNATLTPAPTDADRSKTPAASCAADIDAYQAQNVRLGYMTRTLGEWCKGVVPQHGMLVTYPAWGLMPPSSRGDWDAYVRDMSRMDSLAFRAILYHGRAYASLQCCHLPTFQRRCGRHVLMTVEVTAPWLHPDVYDNEADARACICEALQANKALASTVRDMCDLVLRDDGMRRRAMACKLLWADPVMRGGEPVFDPDLNIVAGAAITWSQAVKVVAYLWAVRTEWKEKQPIIRKVPPALMCFPRTEWEEKRGPRESLVSTAFLTAAFAATTQGMATQHWIESWVKKLTDDGLPLEDEWEIATYLNGIYPLFLSKVESGFHWGRGFGYLESVGASVGGARLKAAIESVRREAVERPLLVSRAATRFPDFHWQCAYRLIEAGQFDAAAKALAAVPRDLRRGFGMVRDSVGGYDTLVYVARRLLDKSGTEWLLDKTGTERHIDENAASPLDVLLTVGCRRGSRLCDDASLTEEDRARLARFRAEAAALERARLESSAAPRLLAEAAARFPSFHWSGACRLIGRDQFEAASKAIAAAVAGSVWWANDGCDDLVALAFKLTTEVGAGCIPRGDGSPVALECSSKLSQASVLVDRYKSVRVDAALRAGEQDSDDVKVARAWASDLVTMERLERMEWATPLAPFLVARALMEFPGFYWRHVAELVGARQFRVVAEHMQELMKRQRMKLSKRPLKDVRAKEYRDLVFTAFELFAEVSGERVAARRGAHKARASRRACTAALLSRLVDGYKRARLEAVLEADAARLTAEQSDLLRLTRDSARRLAFMLAPYIVPGRLGMVDTATVSKARNKCFDFQWRRVCELVGADQFEAAARAMWLAIEAEGVLSKMSQLGAHTMKYVDLLFVAQELLIQVHGQHVPLGRRQSHASEKVAAELVSLVARYRLKRSRRTVRQDRTELTDEAQASFTKLNRATEIHDGQLRRTIKSNNYEDLVAMAPTCLVAAAINRFNTFPWEHVLKLVGAVQFQVANKAVSRAAQKLTGGFKGPTRYSQSVYRDLVIVARRLMTDMAGLPNPLGRCDRPSRGDDMAGLLSPEYAVDLALLVEAYASETYHVMIEANKLERKGLPEEDADALSKFMEDAAAYARLVGVEAGTEPSMRLVGGRELPKRAAGYGSNWDSDSDTTWDSTSVSDSDSDSDS